MVVNIIHGTVANPGKYRGNVVTVTSIEDIKKVNKTSIVVTNNNSPLFSLAFMKAAAIISESGGSLCHLAIVSRELNKPCILGVENALKTFQDGMLVEINSSINGITILEE